MTIEQRLSRLEAAAGIYDLPTNGRQGDWGPSPLANAANIFKNLSKPVPGFTDGSALGSRSYTALNRANYGDNWYDIGEKVSVKDKPLTEHYTIRSFIAVTCGYYATLDLGDKTLCLPLSDLTPLTTGGASAEWVAKHGVAAPSVKEWEIVEFRTRTDKSRWTLTEDGYYKGSATNHKYPLNDMLTGRMSVETGDIHIHSVRRISDNTTWTVGQRVGKAHYPECDATIASFFITERWLFASAGEWTIELVNLTEPRKPLFTTADGVGVNEGDAIWYFSRSMVRIEECRAEKGIRWENHYSTRAAAEAAYEKWLYEQPVLTLRDLREVGYNLTNLELLVKDKLAKK